MAYLRFQARPTRPSVLLASACSRRSSCCDEAGHCRSGCRPSRDLRSTWWEIPMSRNGVASHQRLEELAASIGEWCPVDTPPPASAPLLLHLIYPWWGLAAIE